MSNPSVTSAVEPDRLRDEARSWLAEHWTGREEGSQIAFLDQVIDAGLAAPSWPVERFGRGIAPEVGQVIAEEFARVGAPGAGQDTVNLWANTLLAAGQPALIDEFLRPLMLGNQVVSA